jgi:ATP-dependent Clp protease adaptor protein ClpS
MSTDTLTRNDLESELAAIFDDLWAVVVHDDDVTTFDTVIAALMDLFNHDLPEAERLAWVVHTSGKAVVAVLKKDAAEAGVKGLHGYRIQASMTEA